MGPESEAGDRPHDGQPIETAGGAVQYRRYDDLDHATNDDEIRQVNAFIERLR